MEDQLTQSIKEYSFQKGESHISKVGQPMLSMATNSDSVNALHNYIWFFVKCLIIAYLK